MADSKCILVVDDEKVIRDGCERILAPEGYQVCTGANGQEAMEILRRQPVDLILCDLKMPVMGALEVLDEASKLLPDVPVIIITGHGTVESAVECMKRGAYDFITKPFRADHLLLVVRRALEKQALERRARQLQEERARNLYDLAMEQSRIRTIVTCMADGVLVTNRNLEVVLHNPAAMRLLELSALPSSPATLFDYVADQELCRAVKSLLTGGTSSEWLAMELNRGRRHLRALTAPVYGPENEVLGAVIVLHDITSLKELDEMKSAFVHRVSHELRAPLAAIKQQHTVILDGLAGEITDKQRQLLTRASAKIQGLLDLINDLLDVARIESGHAIQEQVPVQLDELLRETVALLAPKASEHRINLRLELPSEAPRILADPRGMEEVFTNLIINAINYSPDGGEVVVRLVAHSEYIEVQVQDQGVGIAAEDIPRIFDKFYRVQHPRTREVIGTGLGLALVKGIVEAHRGSIEVDSEPGVGSTFRVLLPRLIS